MRKLAREAGFGMSKSEVFDRRVLSTAVSVV
jgi:hypothetical protein